MLHGALLTLTCETCGQTLTTRRATVRFCSRQCMNGTPPNHKNEPPTPRGSYGSRGVTKLPKPVYDPHAPRRPYGPQSVVATNTCEGCGVQFGAKRLTTRFCTEDCNRKHNSKKRYVKISPLEWAKRKEARRLRGVADMREYKRLKIEEDPYWQVRKSLEERWNHVVSSDAAFLHIKSFWKKRKLVARQCGLDKLARRFARFEKLAPVKQLYDQGLKTERHREWMEKSPTAKAKAIQGRRARHKLSQNALNQARATLGVRPWQHMTRAERREFDAVVRRIIAEHDLQHAVVAMTKELTQ